MYRTKEEKQLEVKIITKLTELKLTIIYEPIHEWIQSNDYKNQALSYGVGTGETYIDNDIDFVGYAMEIFSAGPTKQPGNVTLLGSNTGDFSLGTSDAVVLYSVENIGQLDRDYTGSSTSSLYHMIPMLDSNYDTTDYTYYRLVFGDVSQRDSSLQSSNQQSRMRIETIKYTSFITASSNFSETNKNNVHNLVENNRYVSSRWHAELDDAPNSFSVTNSYTGPWLQFNRYHLSQFPNGYEHIGKIMKIYSSWHAATPTKITLLGSNSDDFDVSGNTTVETIIHEQDITTSTNETDLTVDDTTHSRMIEVDMDSNTYQYYRIIFHGVWSRGNQEKGGRENPVVSISYIEFAVAPPNTSELQMEYIANQNVTYNSNSSQYSWSPTFHINDDYTAKHNAICSRIINNNKSPVRKKNNARLLIQNL